MVGVFLHHKARSLRNAHYVFGGVCFFFRGREHAGEFTFVVFVKVADYFAGDKSTFKKLS